MSINWQILNFYSVATFFKAMFKPALGVVVSEFSTAFTGGRSCKFHRYSIVDDDSKEQIEVAAIHDESGYRRLRFLYFD